MKASGDALIVTGDSPPIKETFTVDFTVSGVEIDASVFPGIDSKALRGLELGSMLQSQKLPAFSVLSKTSALFQMYKHSLIKAMPNFFGISVREIC